ncbi:MAG: biotin synthase BioB, partial [Acidimicrobiia bacterium]
MPSLALQVAEQALLDERRSLTRDEVRAVGALPLDELPDLIALAHKVRLTYCGADVELESLINAKSGACPEDCAFCSQSVKFDTGVDVYAYLDVDEVVEAARATKAAGATQFCIVVAVRGPSERLLNKVIETVDAVHAETGLEIACSLGLLTQPQAER